MRKRLRLPYLLLCGVLLIVGIAYLMPYFWMLSTAFQTSQEVYSFPPRIVPSKLGFHNFAKVLKELPFLLYLRNSLIVAVIGTLASVFFSSLGGFVFSKYTFPGRRLLFAIILTTLMLPFPVIVIPLASVMVKLRLQDTFPALIVPNMMSAFGIFMMRQFINTIPNSLLDAARMDGASEFFIYAQVILPLAKPVLVVWAIFVSIFYWDWFLWPLVITTSESVRTLPVGLAMFTTEYTTDWNSMMAAALMAMLPTLIAFIFFQKQIIKGMVLSGLK